MEIKDINISKILIPPKFKYFYKDYKNDAIKILDIGCGNNSPEITKYWFPNSIYHGIDITEPSSLQKNFIDKLYIMDLESSDLNYEIKDEYDVIILSHVIEHINNGEEIVDICCKKLN